MSCDPTISGFTPASDYVLGLAGEQLTEMGMDANGSLAWAHTNVFAAGKLIATYDPDGLHFYMTDPLGTRRAQTDYAGVLEQTCSSLPYGDSLACTGSIQFPTEHHFTGKERDAETNNDYFGARYYSSVMGRFMSPDWANGADAVPYADFGNPQSLNLYGYVRNNPLAGVDADGHILIGQEFNLGPGSVNVNGVEERLNMSGAEPYSNPAFATDPNSSGDGSSGNDSAQQTTGNTTVVTVSATTAVPTTFIGGLLGALSGNPLNGGIGALVGSTFGVGADISYVPSTDSMYAGPTANWQPLPGGGNGVSVSTAIVPPTQNPNSIANGTSYSVTLQPTPLTGTTVTKSPGSGPAVAGPSVGTRVPISFSASHNVDITKAWRAVEAVITTTVRSMFF
ncbi:MAG: RHS repeat-associated core domain-containing protein [Candidatus Korobacteraceae bacterium]|jgi:RHS repeat-associated protein